MFYCDDCKKKNDWPSSVVVSRGKCEVCGVETICNSTPSKYLPIGDKNESTNGNSSTKEVQQ